MKHTTVSWNWIVWAWDGVHRGYLWRSSREHDKLNGGWTTSEYDAIR